MATNLWNTPDIAMKFGMKVLNIIIDKPAKLQAFTFCMKKGI